MGILDNYSPKKVTDLVAADSVSDTDLIPVHDGNGLKKITVADLNRDLIAKSDLMNLAITRKVEGDWILLTDSAECPISEIVIYGKSTQAGTPSPETPVPIESVSGGVLVAGNKNLFNLSKISTVSNITNIFKGNGGAAWGDTVLDHEELAQIIKPNTTYTISLDIECVSVPEHDEDSNNRLGLRLQEREGTIVDFCHALKFLTAGQKRHLTYTYTAGSDLSSLKLYAYTNRYTKTGSSESYCSTMKFTNVQIEEAPAATDYEAHRDVSAEIPFTLYGIPVASNGNHTDKDNQQWRSDELHIRADGTGYLKKYCLQTRSSEWSINRMTKSSSYAANCWWISITQVIAGIPEHASITRVALSSHFRYSPSSYQAGTIGNFQTSNSIDMALPTDITTAEEAANYVKNLDAKFVIATIYDNETRTTELTPAQVKALLLKTFYPVSNIYNNKNADMEITYAVDTKTYIDNKFAVLEALIGGN